MHDTPTPESTSEKGKRTRASSYCFTVEDLNDPRIQELRTEKKARNAARKADGTDYEDRGSGRCRFIERVYIRGRLGKDNPAVKDNEFLKWASYIPQQFATRFDVYVGKEWIYPSEPDRYTYTPPEPTAAEWKFRALAAEAKLSKIMAIYYSA